MTTIYGLVDPRSDKIRYVGRSVNIAARYVAHINAPCSDLMRAWLTSLAEEGLKPVMRTLDICDDDLADVIETRWIRDLAKTGMLLNVAKMSTKGRRKSKPARQAVIPVKRVAVVIEQEGPSPTSTDFLRREVPRIASKLRLPSWADGVVPGPPAFAPPPTR